MQSEVNQLRNKNPVENTNPLCAALFLHMVPIFWRFYKKPINIEDLYESLDEHKSNRLGCELEALWNEVNHKYGKIALHIALLRQFGKRILLIAFLYTFVQVFMLVAVPVAMGGLVSYFQNESKNGNIKDAYYYAGLLFLQLGVRNLSGHFIVFMTVHMCMKMRISCCGLIYRKALRLSTAAFSQTTIGQIVNLLSNDVGKFDLAFFYVSNILVAPFATVAATYVLYDAIGVSAFSGMAFLLMVIPFQIFLGKLDSKIRFRTSTRTDERLRLMNEILSGISVIKMYIWEMPFAKLASKVRRNEVKSIRSHFYIESIRRGMEMILTRMSIFITIIVFVSMGNNIEATTAFKVIAIYGNIRPLLASILPTAIGAAAEIYVCIARIQNFLRSEEIPEFNNKRVGDNTIDDRITTFETAKLVLVNISAKWYNQLPNYSLNRINLYIDRNQLIALVGPVGCGKSTLFNVILKELPVIDGTINIHGNISFASQEPWLFSASVRQNILFGDYHDTKRYKAVLNVCALEADLESFPYGDSTIISEGGKSLSGGQRARINLARCLYRQAQIYLLDDPLSAVDVKVGQYLYEKAIKSFLNDKICVLVTHQLQYLKSADKIVIMNDGSIVEQGTYNELQNSGLDFSKLLKQISSNEEQDLNNTDGWEQGVDKNAENKIVVYQNNESKEVAEIGSVAFETYIQYFKSGGGYLPLVCLILTFIAAHLVANSGDYFIVYWVTLEQHVIKLNETITDTYVNSSMTRGTITYIYSGFILVTIVSAFALALFFFIIMTRASVNMYNSIFKTITCATMRFFNANQTGKIFNRFSKDVGIVDDYVPIVLFDVVQTIISTIAYIILSTIISYWLLLPFAVLLVPIYLSRLLYINTGTGARRLEGIARSPIFNHITASINGLPTIRVFEAQDKLLKEFDAHQDLHSSAWFLFISATRSFALWLDTLTTIFIVIVVLYFLAVDHGYTGGEVGLLINNYLLMNSILSFGVRQACEFENHMVSAERIFDYMKVETEPIKQSGPRVPADWPQFGKIVFKDLSLRYLADGPNILKSVNVTIGAGEKIGVVGRTGAGKSSLIAALFQMYDTEGTILVDGIDVTKMSLQNLRSKISIIPQQPVLFHGTLRKNLDPFEKYSDDLLVNALEQVELKQLVDSCSGGLSTKIQEGGSNFSTGQKQLVCFARAIVCRNKILVIDEATANVDPYTDAVIQKTIRREFSNCTVVTVAHRLHTIIDNDKVLVMDGGSAVEFDHPYNLLRTKNSLFYKMAQATGKDTYDTLFASAERSFKNQL